MPQHQTIIITGASDGIGAAAARQLAAEGTTLVLVGRSPAKTAAVAREVGADHFLADFTDLAQVRELADQLRAGYPRIDVLANNAGGIMGERVVTRDGFEKTFQVNHLAPFLLTTLLLPTLTASKAKVIQTASVAAKRFGRFDIDDLQNEKNYEPQVAYGNGKLANILFTRELHRRYAAQGISAVSFHPGVVRSGFASDTTHLMRFAYHSPLKYLITISPERSARELVRLVRGTPGSTWQSGEYYERRKPAASSAASRDMDLARQLWDRSAQLLSITTP
ncbi:SDR family NAD(P)-dependent oxidoreductase [Actinoplanes sp. GCM10030250]|uniref:SDR family NAD(P)-dependent oxidoreductase n=1 Tax=Actinoplanes sp. GCM10030250 TaxID=3273376 RepID=UPI00361DFFD7